MPQQYQRRIETGADGGTRIVQKFTEVFDQRILRRQATSFASRFAMTTLIESADGKTRLRQFGCQTVVSPSVLAQSVHDDHHRTRCHAMRQRPVVDGQTVTVKGREGRLDGLLGLKRYGG